MQLKKLHPVSIILAVCCFLVIITSLAEFISRGLTTELLSHDGNIWSSGAMSRLINDLTYGVGSIGTAAIIEYLRKISRALEKSDEKAN